MKQFRQRQCENPLSSLMSKKAKQITGLGVGAARRPAKVEPEPELRDRSVEQRYLPDQASWLKIRNTSYSQWEGRQELFDREREGDPDLALRDDCVKACADLPL
jgi:hypothetical protein